MHPPPPLPLYHAHSCFRYHSDSALKVVDEALGSAAEVTKKTTKKVDWAFKKAIEELERYETRYHRKPTVNKRMAAAKEKDGLFSTIWDLFKEMFSPKVRLGRIPLLHLVLIMCSRLPTINSKNQPKSSSSFCSSPFLTRGQSS